ncbi:MAG TPA: hypothetical protein VHY80_11830 [Stellaceae bacterium]|nr:hypothetical protein [Stellaceae bacterium]
MAIASFALVGAARADNDGISKQSQTTVTKQATTCTFTEGTPTTNTTNFSFDISWVDAADRAYLLADRSHGAPSTDTEGGMLSGATVGDVLYIDINNPTTATPLTPPANDPYAGIRCDANAKFGGTNAAGRNEITGPNGVFTVNHTEAWVGDAPSYFTPGQTNSASDYASDKCDSSVRVFDLISRQQIDHINVGGCFRTDEGAFDPVDQVAIFANPSEQSSVEAINHNATAVDHAPFVTLISTSPVAPGQHHKILKQINFDGTNGTVLADQGVEQAVYSEKTGMFYVAIPGTSTNPGGYVTVIDPRSNGDNDSNGDSHGHGDGNGFHVVTNFKITNNCAPNGAALGPDNELFLGCSAGTEQVIDIRNGHLIALLTGTTGGCDEVAYNAGDNSFYGACTDSNSPPFDNIDISDAQPPKFDAAINVGAAGAHSIAADRVTVTEWMPMFGGACGSGVPCVAVYGSTGGDDPGRVADNH